MKAEIKELSNGEWEVSNGERTYTCTSKTFAEAVANRWKKNPQSD